MVEIPPMALPNPQRKPLQQSASLRNRQKVKNTPVDEEISKNQEDQLLDLFLESSPAKLNRFENATASVKKRRIATLVNFASTIGYFVAVTESRIMQ